MVNPVRKIIDANDVKNGETVSFVTKTGVINSYRSGDPNSETGMDLDTRFDNPRFFKGDSSGLQTTATYTIAAGADDGAARKNSSSSSNSSYNTGFSNSSAKNYVGVQDDEGNTDYYAAYFRFNNVVAEQGATIQSAYFKINKRGFSGGDRDFNFYVAAYDDDNETAPTTAAGLNHSNYTTAEVAWHSNTDTGNGTLRSASNETVLSSPDIKTAIQEVVDRSGWSSGNSIVIAFYPKTNVSGGYNQMVYVEMYDDSGDVPAQLEITV